MTQQAVAAGTAVALRQLHRSYGDVHAVDGVDLTIAPGEVVALLGPNGAGKSTAAQGMAMVTLLLFSMLGGVLIPPGILPAVLVSIAKVLPSYWLVDIAMGRVTGAPIPMEGIAVMVVWVLVIGGLVATRYRRDALRV